MFNISKKFVDMIFFFFQVNPDPFPRGHLSRAGQFQCLSVNTISNPGWKKIWIRQVTVSKSFHIPLRDSWRNIAIQVVVIFLDDQSSFLIRDTKHEVKKRVVMHGCQSHRQCRLALEEKIVWDKKFLVSKRGPTSRDCGVAWQREGPDRAVEALGFHNLLVCYVTWPVTKVVVPEIKECDYITKFDKFPGVLCRSLGRGVLLGHLNPCPILNHNQIDFATVF